MTVPNGDEREIDTVTLRVALITWRLVGGWTPTTREVATYCSMRENSAWDLLSRMTDVLPLFLDREDGRWRLVEKDDQTPRRHYVAST
jgi:hypothetical protein